MYTTASESSENLAAKTGKARQGRDNGFEREVRDMHIPVRFSLKSVGYRQMSKWDLHLALEKAPIKTVQGIQHSNPTSGNAPPKYNRWCTDIYGQGYAFQHCPNCGGKNN